MGGKGRSRLPAMYGMYGVSRCVRTLPVMGEFHSVTESGHGFEGSHSVLRPCEGCVGFHNVT